MLEAAFYQILVIIWRTDTLAGISGIIGIFRALSVSRSSRFESRPDFRCVFWLHGIIFKAKEIFEMGRLKKISMDML